jgi:hypothetical protein
VQWFGQISVCALLHAPEAISRLVVAGAEDDLDIVGLDVVFQKAIVIDASKYVIRNEKYYTYMQT